MVTGVRRAARLLGTALGLAALISMAGLAAAQALWTAPAGEQGRKVAQINCVTCHGAKGKGDGAAAVALNPKPADWTSKAVQDDTDGELFWKISTGRGAMPAWRHLPEKDRWALVGYIRSLAAK